MTLSIVVEAQKWIELDAWGFMIKSMAESQRSNDSESLLRNVESGVVQTELYFDEIWIIERMIRDWEELGAVEGNDKNSNLFS